MKKYKQTIFNEKINITYFLSTNSIISNRKQYCGEYDFQWFCILWFPIFIINNSTAYNDYSGDYFIIKDNLNKVINK